MLCGDTADPNTITGEYEEFNILLGVNLITNLYDVLETVMVLLLAICTIVAAGEKYQ